MKIIITGGCGYVGTELTKFLLSKGHFIKVIDTQWFGNYLLSNKRLKIIKKDIRQISEKDLVGYERIIHLANIANDLSAILNVNLSWDVNVLAIKRLVEKSIAAGIKQFIYSSSGSVYGLRKEKKVVESTDLTPISIYNKTKMIAERTLISYQDKIKIHCIRPATVCGYSDKMRLDLTVNALTFSALKNKKIIVHGGKQVRPNVNIKDLINIFYFFLKNKSLQTGFYNAGFENMSVLKIAKKVSQIIPSKIEIKKIFDPRHYYLDSTKLIKEGFKPNYSVENAIIELKNKYKEKKIFNNINFYSIKKLKKLKIR